MEATLSMAHYMPSVFGKTEGIGPPTQNTASDVRSGSSMTYSPPHQALKWLALSQMPPASVIMPVTHSAWNSLPIPHTGFLTSLSIRTKDSTSRNPSPQVLGSSSCNLCNHILSTASQFHRGKVLKFKSWAFNLATMWSIRVRVRWWARVKVRISVLLVIYCLPNYYKSCSSLTLNFTCNNCIVHCKSE